MRVFAAQFSPVAGDVDQNLTRHLHLTRLAAAQRADLLFFPELSLTGYEPSLAAELTMLPDDPRLKPLCELAESCQLILGVGLPTRSSEGVRISMLWFYPNRETVLYSKQTLHSDEQPFFTPGDKDILIIGNSYRFAPAICYESMDDAHAQRASDRGADFYLASVAKHEKGLQSAQQHYPAIAQRYRMRILMANSYGLSDGFTACGHSAVWDKNGERIDQLSANEAGIVGFDTQSGESIRDNLDAARH